MNDSSSNQSAINRFWEKFIDRLLKQGVKKNALRWFVLRAEQYIEAFPDKRLAEHSVEDLNRYLQEAGRKGGIAEKAELTTGNLSKLSMLYRICLQPPGLRLQMLA